ncbi:MAG: 50S ribosomal protein L15 [Candidatus Doudnabacteria bacterium]|nr:50S ribosomal protein L15 [Candidatus Doudnabacteria bacterium]
MLKLHTIKKHPKSTHRRKVVGRGIGSGHGTYATRGNKGQTKRTGHTKMPVGFEGGRQPLMRQLPKLRGFRSLSAKSAPVSVSQLDIFKDGDTVDLKSLVQKGIILEGQKAKLLAGEIKRKLTVKLPVSAAAKSAIEKAGGSVE